MLINARDSELVWRRIFVRNVGQVIFFIIDERETLLRIWALLELAHLIEYK